MNKLLDQNEDTNLSLPLNLLKIHKMTSEVNLNTVGVAAPVIHPAVLEALGVSGVTTNPDIGAFHAQMSGFPKQEAATSTAFVSPMTAYNAESFINPDQVRTYDPPLRDGMIAFMRARQDAPE